MKRGIRLDERADGEYDRDTKELVFVSEEFSADLVTVLDEDGHQHQFEILDAIETDSGRYVALLPVYENPDELVDDDGELIILQVEETDGEEVLVPIEDEIVFEEIAGIFEERLSDVYDIESEDDAAADEIDSDDE